MGKNSKAEEKRIKKAGDDLLSRREGSIIGKRGLDFRVRDGNGYFPSLYNHQQKALDWGMNPGKRNTGE